MTESWRPLPNEVYQSWIDTIQEEASDKLNDWENSFIAQIGMKIFNGYTLTQAQAEVLERLYVNKTS
jgi:uncharacterized protein YgfB (UPF0149 family)